MSDARPTRLAAIDRMRGFVMVLMALDHASMFFNGGRVAMDSAGDYLVGSSLPALQFFARWITHLCAPTFLFLAGTALALSAARRQAKGLPERAFDRDMLIRGMVIAGIELGFLGAMAPHRLYSVLFAIGVSMILMIPIRRLPPRVIAALAIAWFVGGEWVTSWVWQGEGHAPLWAALTVAWRYTDEVHVLYPVLHWLPMMMLGWVFGVHLQARRVANAAPPIKLLLGWGAAGLLVFAVVRGLGGYGNMFMPADDGTLAQWLHVSKYPPSLAFVSLELGLMAWCLAAFWLVEPRFPPRDNGLLMVLGQTALFFYVLHFLFLGISGIGTRVALGGAMDEAPGDLGVACLAAAAVIMVLYPICRWFRRYKRAHPEAWVRFI